MCYPKFNFHLFWVTRLLEWPTDGRMDGWMAVDGYRQPIPPPFPFSFVGAED
jgi:hypothetical protein